MTGFARFLRVIASQRVGPKGCPMTGSAKQSIAPHGKKGWIASSLTLLAMTGLERFLRVIASQRVGPKGRPMTGSAKQSIAPRGKKGWIASSLTLLAMTGSAHLLKPGRFTKSIQFRNFRKNCLTPG